MKNKPFRIGFAGLYFPVMAAEENRVFEKGKAILDTLASEESIDIVSWPKMICETNEAVKAAAFFDEQEIDFLLVQISSLIMGDTVLPLVEKFEKIGVWVLDEPTYSGDLPLNSLTGYNLFVSLVRGAWGERKKLKWLWGMGPEFSIRLRLTIKALSTLARIKDRTILSIGGVVPSFGNLEINADSFQASLGIHVENLELAEFFGWS